MSTTIWHNPRCSKSRQTLALLVDREIEPNVVLYLETPPDAKELDSVLTKLGQNPRDLMRKGEEAYKTLGLDNHNLTRDQLIGAMIANPALIERPVVINGDKATVGRPPENVLKIL